MNKTITLERLKRSILNEVRSGDQEGRCLAQYKREMELLQQEKMSHVEELRQIHADINAMETVIKQTEESMTRKLSNASRLHEDYRPLKTEVDLLRRQYLGLDRLPDLHEEEGSPITPERFPALQGAAGAGAGGAGGAGARGALLATPRKPPPPPPAFRSALDQDFITVSLRQQPPPMKSCLSCHQQIHRNAPICPLCKAKSRSRNPKKPKKK
ncbi:zinc finger C4H2 domain-containing protein isoform X2 [Manduca sexta]|uniref:zinc finger C4H2 domain-containing protein isoform X2 n=1 Tax=Manduca sexta TaxID=7130 RepID=UPI00188F000C|nr:zinc finger C4H2 domain-containing protein isoform X2 [Manduca sexta]